MTNFPDATSRTRSFSPWSLRRFADEKTDIVHEWHRCGAGAAIAGIDLDEVGRTLEAAPLHFLEHGIEPIRRSRSRITAPTSATMSR